MRKIKANYFIMETDYEVMTTEEMAGWKKRGGLYIEQKNPECFKRVIKVVGCLQCITHRSEEPEHHMEYLLPSEHPITEKLYIIDDGDHSIMLLANEY